MYAYTCLFCKITRKWFLKDGMLSFFGISFGIRCGVETVFHSFGLQHIYIYIHNTQYHGRLSSVRSLRKSILKIILVSIFEASFSFLDSL